MQKKEYDNGVSRVDPSVEATQKEALKNPALYWGEQAKMLTWHQTWHSLKETSFHKENLHIRWFDDADHYRRWHHDFHRSK